MKELVERMAEYHFYSGLMEHVADALATRSATCLDDLPAQLAACYDAPNARQNYLRMQEVLTDLPLRDRAALGRQFAAVIENLRGRAKGYTQATAQLGIMPDWIFDLWFIERLGTTGDAALHGTDDACGPDTLREVAMHDDY